MIKRLPQFAESHFATLCAAGGVICNPSQQDEAGWDFFIQFPAILKPGVPADMQEPGAEALVQIKSTTKAAPNARMKLSNALKAAQSGQPCFLVMVVPGANALQPRLYARHFWEPEIARALRSVRQAEYAGDTAFHRRWFNMRLGADDDHTDDLVAWMAETIAAHKPYGTTKSHLAATVGFEDGYGNAQVTFSAPIADVLDWNLGLKDGLPLDRFTYTPRRFGLDAPTPQIDIEGATLHVTNAGQPCELCLRGGLPTSSLTLPATFYRGIIPDLGGKLNWRVSAGPLEIIGSGRDRNMRMTIRTDEHKALSEIDAFLRIATWPTADGLDLELNLNGSLIPLGMLEFTPDDDSGTAEMARAVTLLADVARKEPLSDPVLSLAEINSAAPQLNRFWMLGSNGSMRVEFKSEGPQPPLQVMLYYLYCTVGDWAFLALLERPIKTDLMIGERRQVTFGPPQLLDGLVRAGPAANHLTEIQAAYDRQRQRHRNLDPIWEIGDLEQFFWGKR